MKTKTLKVLATTLTLLAANGAYAACAVTDATYSPNHPLGPYQFANACVDFTSVNPAPGQGGNIALSDINTQWSSLYGGGTFQTASKDDGDITSPNVSLFGGIFNFSIDAISLGATSGTYLLTATDADQSTDPNFPIFLDFVIGLKGGSSASAAYLFDNVIFDGSGGGAWTVTFANAAGQTPGLSNLTLFVREGTMPNGGDDDNFVPEPATLALLGLGLIGLAASRRRKNS